MECLTLSKKLYHFWQEQSPKNKAIMATTAPLWGPFVIAGGAGITAVGLLGMVGGCCCMSIACNFYYCYGGMCCMSKATYDKDQKAFEECAGGAAFITADGITLIGEGLGAMVAGIPVGIYQTIEACREGNPTEQSPLNRPTV